MSVKPAGGNGSRVKTSRVARAAGATCLMVFLLLASGCVLWGSAGIEIGQASTDKAMPGVIRTGDTFIVAWQEKRAGSFDIYAQKLDLDGNTLWSPATGVQVGVSAGDQERPRIAPDGAGGAIVTWRNAQADNIYANRVAGNGSRPWGDDSGKAVGPSAGSQNVPEMVTDGSGNAVIVWRDNRSGTWEIFGQRLNTSGSPLWGANGRSLMTIGYGHPEHRMVTDGSGGAIIAYLHGSDNHLRTARVDSSGNRSWTHNTTIDTHGARHTAITSDGAGGAVVVWRDDEVGYETRVLAQRVRADGTNLGWPNGGRQLSENGLEPDVARINGDSVVVTWRHTYQDVYAQRLKLDNGSGLWGLNGRVVCSTRDNVNAWPRIDSDLEGNSYITWIGFRDAPWLVSLFGQKLNLNGVRQVGPAGDRLSNRFIWPRHYSIVWDGVEGAVVVSDSANDKLIIGQRFSTPLP